MMANPVDDRTAFRQVDDALEKALDDGKPQIAEMIDAVEREHTRILSYARAWASQGNPPAPETMRKAAVFMALEKFLGLVQAKESEIAKLLRGK